MPSLLRERREAAGITQEDLAKRAGISVRTLIRYEQGTTSPPVPIAIRLADALGCDLSDIVGAS